MDFMRISSNKMLKLCNNTSLKINNYLITDEQVIFYINNFELYTDFKIFCYINNKNDDFNYNILLKKKTPNNIVTLLLSNNNIKDNLEYVDYFNLKYNINNYSKNELDYTILYNNLLKKETLLKSKSINSLSLKSEQICNIIINEIKKVNTNINYKHYINIKYDNPYLLEVKLFINNIILDLNINIEKYPIYPPIINIISPMIKEELYLGLLNINILQIKNWLSSITIEYIIINLVIILEPIINNYICDIDNYKIYNKNILNLAYLNKDKELNILKLDIDIPKIEILETEEYWTRGTGYSNNKLSNWDINKYIYEQELLNDNILINIKNINKNFDNIIINKYLINFINTKIKSINILELNNNINIYNEVFILLDNLYDKYKNELQINDLKKLYDELCSIEDILDDNKIFIKKVIYKYIKDYTIITIVNIENYCNVMKKYQFTNKYEIPEYHNFYKYCNNTIINNKTKMRMISEISSLQSVLPLTIDSSIWFFSSKKNLNIFTFIISGPKNTPYENGLFEFHGFLPANYPDEVPLIHFHTTGENTFRFNPNLYANGKVCLSLLNTWDGHESEKWNPKTSTILQILISIQSLIFIENPYFNEPSYEKIMHTDKGKKLSNEYNNNIYPKTIEIAMINTIINAPIELSELIKTHFLLKKDFIIEMINKWNINNNLQLLIDKLVDILNKL
jgi:ubiquitin-protein ligase